ncbi:MAG: glutaredoxin family protein [Solirubrobacteraceae bacterium]
MKQLTGWGEHPLAGVTEVVLYTRPGCHLCDEARAILERVRAEASFVLRERDISSDDALHARYLERIPVVTINGEEAFELEVDEAVLRERLVRVQR